MQFLFFLDIAEATYDHFRLLANSTFWASLAAVDSRLSFTQVDGNFDESGIIAVFDWIVEGTITYTTPYNFELEGFERFKFAFDTSTGVMKGYRLELDYKGVIEGEKFEVVGLVKRIGNPQDDAQVYIPIEVAKELFDDDEISSIFVQV